MEIEQSKQIVLNSRVCQHCQCILPNHNRHFVHHLKCPYICLCQKEVKTECEYWKHLHDKDLILYKCCICERIFKRKFNLIQHMAKHDGLEKYSCQYCNSEFPYFDHLACHVFVNGIGNPLECLVCHKFFQSKCALAQHEKFDHEANTHFHIKVDSIDSTLFKCVACIKFFTRHIDLMEHIAMQHTGMVMYICQDCKEEFSGFDTLSFHISANKVGNINECVTCHELFGSKCALVKHEKTIHAGIVGSNPKKKRELNGQKDRKLTTANPTSQDFAFTTAKTNRCKPNSPYFVPDLQRHYEPQKLREYPTCISPIFPYFQQHPDYSLQARPQSSHPILRPRPIRPRLYHTEIIHDMTYHMSYHSSDLAYRRLQHDLAFNLAQQCQLKLAQGNPICPWQYNSSHSLSRNSSHYIQEGRIT